MNDDMVSKKELMEWAEENTIPWGIVSTRSLHDYLYPEPVKPWWLIDGLWFECMYEQEMKILTYINGDFYESTYAGGLYEDTITGKPDSYRPISGPFDCIPPWATEISFFNAGSYAGCFRGHNHDTMTFCWIASPDELKGKTFPITEDMR